MYRYLRCGGICGFHIQGRLRRITLLQFSGENCWKCRVGRSVVGTRKKAEICGIDWRKST